VLCLPIAINNDIPGLYQAFGSSLSPRSEPPFCGAFFWASTTCGIKHRSSRKLIYITY
jgi:hypothetical protein